MLNVPVVNSEFIKKNYIVTLSVTKCNNKCLRYLTASLVSIKLGYDQLHGQTTKLTINIYIGQIKKKPALHESHNTIVASSRFFFQKSSLRVSNAKGNVYNYRCLHNLLFQRTRKN